MSDHLRLVIFDLDGTLIHGLSEITAIMQGLISREGYEPPSMEQVKQSIGLPLPIMFERFVPHVSSDVHHALAAAYTENRQVGRAQGNPPEPLYPGAREALTGLDQAGMLLAISTSKSRAGADYALKGHGLDALFVKVRCPDDGHMKPHPDAVHDILAKIGVEARHTLFVGDTETDMMTAANAGVKALGVGWGYHSVDMLLNAGAAGIAQEFGEVPALVEELIGT